MSNRLKRVLVCGGVFVAGLVVGVVGVGAAVWVLVPMFGFWWIWEWLFSW